MGTSLGTIWREGATIGYCLYENTVDVYFLPVMHSEQGALLLRDGGAKQEPCKGEHPLCNVVEVTIDVAYGGGMSHNMLMCTTHRLLTAEDPARCCGCSGIVFNGNAGHWYDGEYKCPEPYGFGGF